MFFNLFAAREPSANVCVAHGTLCNDPSVYPTFSNKSETAVLVQEQNCGCEFHARQFRSVSVELLVATHGTPVEKH